MEQATGTNYQLKEDRQSVLFSSQIVEKYDHTRAISYTQYKKVNDAKTKSKMNFVVKIVFFRNF